MDDCILFSGFRNKDGYGIKQVKFKDGKWRPKGAHRISYCEYHGITIDEINGKVILHTCDNPPCINPEHLVLGTQSENVADMYLKGRSYCRTGSSNPNAKLNQTIADSIRADYLITKSYSKLADKYGVGRSTISRVIRGVIF
jgi:hypothetical protein